MTRLGPPVGMTWTCAHMPDLNPPACGEPATRHGINWDEFVSVFSCDDHAPKMREVTEVDHPVGSACGLPGSVYSDALETCVMPDTDGHLEALIVSELEAAQ